MLIYRVKILWNSIYINQENPRLPSATNLIFIPFKNTQKYNLSIGIALSMAEQLLKKTSWNYTKIISELKREHNPRFKAT